MRPPPRPAPVRRQRGVALLLAMIVVALITAAAAAMAWQQERAVAIEGAERARAQSAWILNGALDWARLILREDERAARRGGGAVDSLDEPWAQPLAEARLSSFLAADRDNNADGGPEAFISGAIEDAQSRFNLRGVVDATGQVDAAQLAALVRLVELAVRLRSRWRQRPYGDQGLLLGRQRLAAAGGIPPLPLMEDLLLVERLAAQGRLRSLGAALRVDGRRWRRLGVWRTTWRNLQLRRAWRRGIPAAELARRY